MKIPFSPPDIREEEIEEVVDTLKSGWITTGPKTKLFEERIAKYCNTSKAVCLNSATACMELTLRLLGVGEGDEVITSAYTYTASASVVYHVGAKLVLVDTAPNSYEMDYEKLSKAITKNTKVIIPVDLGGIMCDYDKIYEVINGKKNMFTPKNKIQEAFGRIIVLSDAAHAFGAKRKKKMCGEVADFTSFSFHAVKNLTTAEGGALVWKDTDSLNNDEIYRKLMLLSLHGQSKDALAKNQLGAWEYDILYPAYKCNMTDIMASIGLAQLNRYKEILDRRKQIIEKYNELLKDKNIQVMKHYSNENISSGHLYMIRLLGKDIEFRNNLIIKLAKKGISTNVHYKPLPMHTAYKNKGFNIKDFPNSYDMYKNEITLPLNTCLSDEEINYIIEELLKNI